MPPLPPPPLRPYSLAVDVRRHAGSGWVPAGILALGTAAVVAAYGTPIGQVATFAAYVMVGLALPGALWVRLLRGHPTHIAEDLTLGLTVGYCLELVTYLVARAAGAPLLFLLWPIATLLAFAAVPGLRRHWRGGGVRAPAWWSWSLAALLAYVLVYSAATFFGRHALSGTYAPYVDMPYHLALIGELKNHVPPQIPYVEGVPLAYHWFFYADAAATSWATGIEPVTLLFRLSGLPMFVAFVVLTAAAARRLTGGWWSGPAAVVLALLATVAVPYAATAGSVFDAQTLPSTWISPTNLFGLALFAAVLVVFMDLVHIEGRVLRGRWVLVGLLVFGAAGAKATLLPLLIGGLLTVLAGAVIGRRRVPAAAIGGLAFAVGGAVLAIVLLFRGSTGGLTIGMGSLIAMPVAKSVGAGSTHGIAAIVIPAVAFLIALVLWSFMWAGAYGLLVRRRDAGADPRILLLLGVCAAALGAAVVFLYPGLSELYYLRTATGAFALLTVAGISALIPADVRRGPLIAGMAVAALIGGTMVRAIRAIGPDSLPRLGRERWPVVVLGMVLPVIALVLVTVAGARAARAASRRSRRLAGTAPLLVVALVMGFSLPAMIQLVASPLETSVAADPAIPGDGITAAVWLRDHSDPADVLATNLHCRRPPAADGACDARNFWVSAYAERRALVEGWAYTAPAIAAAARLGVSDRTVPFWDQPLLALNDQVFEAPTAGNLAALRDQHGVRWLFADLASADGDALARLATLRYRSGDFAVYELP